MEAPKKLKKNPRKPKRAIAPVMDKAIAVTVIAISVGVVQTIAQMRKTFQARHRASRKTVVHHAHHVTRSVLQRLNVPRQMSRQVAKTAVTVAVAAVAVVVTAVTSRLKTPNRKDRRSPIRLQRLLKPRLNSVPHVHHVHQHLPRPMIKPICKPDWMRRVWQKMIRIRPIRSANAAVVAAVVAVVARMKAQQSSRKMASWKAKATGIPQALPCLAPRLPMLNLVLPAPRHLRRHLPLSLT